MTRIGATKIGKEQEAIEFEIKTVDSIPKASELANMNTNTIIFDEVNGIMHYKGKKHTWKLGGWVKE